MKPEYRTIYLRDSDGGIRVFDPIALQSRLIRAFIASNSREQSYISDEIVLALEYTLLHLPQKELIFNCGEVDAAVVRILENCGFPAVAAEFRRTGSEALLRVSVEPVSVSGLLDTHLGCSADRTAKISIRVSEAMKTLGITEASPHLLMELARHYERDLAEKDLLSDVVYPDVAAAAARDSLSREDIYPLLSEDARNAVAAGILKINSITPLFDGITFFLFLGNLCRENGLNSPVTELELYPVLVKSGELLEDCRRRIAAHLAACRNCEPENIACCLAIPDMSDFMREVLCCKVDKDDAAELASIITSRISPQLHALSFD